MKKFLITTLLLIYFYSSEAQQMSPVGLGWAGTSINTVVFRKNSVVTYQNIQYTSYYDSSGYVMLAKRMLHSNHWEIKRTPYKGNINDAHNSISIMVDDDGFLHLAWDHHASKLRYCKSKQPNSLELTEELPMVGRGELNVTYPEFYKIKNGDLLYLYRDGASGKGNLILNRYSLKSKTWQRVHDNLIDGEGKRNAYWQACVDDAGTFHISWVWRESGDVASNHDMCYAKSEDGGVTWRTSANKIYAMPINAASAELVFNIPQRSELINSTSMTTDSNNRPYIVTYWRPANTEIPQYHILYLSGKTWHVKQVSDRKTPFTLGGTGTKRIPIARPQIVINKNEVYIIFRDSERGNKVSLYVCKKMQNDHWETIDLSTDPVGQWEPSFDTEIWRTKKELHLFLENTGQGDGEKTESKLPQMVSILEWKP